MKTNTKFTILVQPKFFEEKLSSKVFNNPGAGNAAPQQSPEQPAMPEAGKEDDPKAIHEAFLKNSERLGELKKEAENDQTNQELADQIANFEATYKNQKEALETKFDTRIDNIIGQTGELLQQYGSMENQSSTGPETAENAAENKKALTEITKVSADIQTNGITAANLAILQTNLETLTDPNKNIDLSPQEEQAIKTAMERLREGTKKEIEKTQAEAANKGVELQALKGQIEKKQGEVDKQQAEVKRLENEIKTKLGEEKDKVQTELDEFKTSVNDEVGRLEAQADAEFAKAWQSKSVEILFNSGSKTKIDLAFNPVENKFYAKQKGADWKPADEMDSGILKKHDNGEGFLQVMKEVNNPDGEMNHDLAIKKLAYFIDARGIDNDTGQMKKEGDIVNNVILTIPTTSVQYGDDDLLWHNQIGANAEGLQNVFSQNSAGREAILKRLVAERKDDFSDNEDIQKFVKDDGTVNEAGFLLAKNPDVENDPEIQELKTKLEEAQKALKASKAELSDLQTEVNNQSPSNEAAIRRANEQIKNMSEEEMQKAAESPGGIIAYLKSVLMPLIATIKSFTEGKNYVYNESSGEIMEGTEQGLKFSKLLNRTVDQYREEDKLPKTDAPKLDTFISQARAKIIQSPDAFATVEGALDYTANLEEAEQTEAINLLADYYSDIIAKDKKVKFEDFVDKMNSSATPAPAPPASAPSAPSNTRASGTPTP